ncbi:MAG TPA: TolC family protein [Cyclobacteriaceae bacterium]|nr:TolC family protein [Cyclobacteriaceae bacterium]
MKTLPPKTPFTIPYWGLLLLLLYTPLQAQSPLDNYIQEGLKSNLVLRQKNLSLKQAEESLQIARSYFLPSVNLLGDYISGQGGRSIGIPVGDLLNPVYSTLNQLTESGAFPQIENVKQNFFPKNFYDARVRTSIPLINTDLYVNNKIKSQEVLLQQFEIDAYKRELILDIKTAYFQYLSAVAAVKIHESALVLVNKNVSLNESMLRNGTSLPSQYLRSKSEAEQVKANLNSAQNQAINAQKYFNFLLNRDLAASIDTNDTPFETSFDRDSITSVARREELKMLKQAITINESVLQLNQLSRLPKVNAFLDLGTQASNWRYNDQSRYYLFGVQLSVPIFQGFRTNAAIRQSKLAIEQSSLNLANTNRQLQLSAEIAESELQTATQNYIASQEQLKSAQSYFHLVEKGYQQGVNSLIEFLDARNQLTSAQLQQNLRQFEVLIASAKVERETASYTFEN